MDDVLVAFNQSLLDYYNKKYGATLSRSDLVNYHFAELFKCTQERSVEIVEEFYQSTDHISIAPIIGAIEAIEKLKKYTLILISARPEHIRESTEQILATHFPESFSHVHLTGEYHKPQGIPQTKGEIAKKLGIRLFFEDSLSNAHNISSHDIPVILFDTPWNQGALPEKVTRVTSWSEALTIAEKILEEN